METLYKKNNKKNLTLHKAGFTVLEVLIACAIISITTFSLISASVKGIQLSDKALKQTQASILLEEGAEVVKIIRDNNWTTIANLTLETNYYPSFDTGSNTWSLGVTPTSAIDSTFTRTVVISSVDRDGSDDIVTSGGTIDSRTKKVTVTVSWLQSGNTASKTLVFYISDIFN